MTVPDSDSKTPDHLGRGDQTFYWDWRGENPVEVVLVLFILVMFFMFPRSGCGIDKTHQTSQQPAQKAKQPVPDE